VTRTQFISTCKRVFSLTARRRVRLFALFLGIAIVWFAADSVYRSIQDVGSLHLYDLSTISANEIHLSIDSFDPDTAKVQVTARPAYADLFIVDDMQRRIPEFVNPQLGAEATPNVRFGKLYVSDLGPFFQAGGLSYAQLEISPKPPECTSKPTDANDTAESDVWKALEMPLDGNFFSLWKGAEMYPFDEYLVVGRADRVVELCAQGKSFSSDSTLDVSVSLPGFSVRSATPTELRTWPTLANSEPPTNAASLFKSRSELQAQHLLSALTYNDRMWREQQLALIIRRPLAIRRMAILLFGITTIATTFLAVTCVRTQIALNFVGSLLTIWTVRGLLNLNAPKTPNLLDYFAMFLFAVLASIYIWRYLWLWPSKTSHRSLRDHQE